MFNPPDRISISPVHCQKREDDFYLVDRKAFPGKGTEYIRADIHEARIEELEAENKRLREALIKAAREHRVIAGMDLIGASATAYNAAREAEAELKGQADADQARLAMSDGSS